jgi:long-chain acyl-CoA synthetase
MEEQKFWKKSWDEGIADLDPSLWEITYPELVRSTFRDFPHQRALTFLGVDMTFAELDSFANRFAQMLVARGFEKGDVVGINLPNIPEYVIAWLGSHRAGCAITGVSPLLSAGEMAQQLGDSGAKGLVTLDAIFAARLTGIAKDLPGLELVVTTSVGGFLPFFKRFLGKLLGKIPKGSVTPLAGKTVLDFHEVLEDRACVDEAPQVHLTPDDTAFIQYTGGTTGSPKGAVLSHRNVVSNVMVVTTWVGWEKGDSIALSAFPMFHIAGLFFAECCVSLGWTQVLIPNPRDTDRICSEMARHRPRILANVPSLYQMLLGNPRFRQLDHGGLEVCMSAAAPFPEESQKKLEDAVREGILLELYGMSETSPLTTMNPRKGRRKLGSIGLPIPNTDIRLKDPATGKVVARGEPGEICIKGPQVMKGYHNRPDETARVFDEEGYLHTGDVAVQDEDGYLRIVDRTKDMIIVGGFKVFSKMVEEVLAGHPAVDTIAIVGVPNPERPGSEIVVAALTLVPGKKGGSGKSIEGELAAFAKEKLAPYECPKKFVVRDELPLTSVGKVDKKALRQELRAP